MSNKSQIASQALSYISALYDVEREVKYLTADERLRIRQARSRPLADAFHQWMGLQRRQITDGSATARALDYSLKRWGALTRFLDDGQLPIDNNWAENQIRPIAIGRKNWLFAGSLRAGQRAAAAMSLIQSARLNGHDPYVYLKDMLQRLPTHKNHLIAELLPHRWRSLHSRHLSGTSLTVSTRVRCVLTFEHRLDLLFVIGRLRQGGGHHQHRGCIHPGLCVVALLKVATTDLHDARFFVHQIDLVALFDARLRLGGWPAASFLPVSFCRASSLTMWPCESALWRDALA